MTRDDVRQRALVAESQSNWFLSNGSESVVLHLDPALVFARISSREHLSIGLLEHSAVCSRHNTKTVAFSSKPQSSSPAPDFCAHLSNMCVIRSNFWHRQRAISCLRRKARSVTTRLDWYLGWQWLVAKQESPWDNPATSAAPPHVLLHTQYACSGTRDISRAGAGLKSTAALLGF